LVRQVLPSVVLIRTLAGLGSGAVLDDKGNIVRTLTSPEARSGVQRRGVHNPDHQRVPSQPRRNRRKLDTETDQEWRDGADIA
jgi:hypothetical protein